MNIVECVTVFSHSFRKNVAYGLNKDKTILHSQQSQKMDLILGSQNKDFNQSYFLNPITKIIRLLSPLRNLLLFNWLVYIMCNYCFLPTIPLYANFSTAYHI